MTTATDRRRRFRTLHEHGMFVIPNPWDVGSARQFARRGAPALATTSAGFARSIGLDDYGLDRDRLVDHVAALVAATDVPLSVDGERCFADDPAGVAETVRVLADAGAAGCSIEDYDAASDAIDPVEVSVERVAAAVAAAHRDDAPMLVTARCEHHLRGVDVVEATIDRLRAYIGVGADCVYAPGLTDLRDIIDVVAAVSPTPVNVLLMPGGPSLTELAAAGVRRVSTGSALADRAYAAASAEVDRLLGQIG